MLMHKMAIESYLLRTVRTRDKEARRSAPLFFVRRQLIMK